MTGGDPHAGRAGEATAGDSMTPSDDDVPPLALQARLVHGPSTGARFEVSSELGVPDRMFDVHGCLVYDGRCHPCAASSEES